MTATTPRAGGSSTDFYYVRGERVRLERDPGVYAVRLRAAGSGTAPDLSPPSRRLLTEESVQVAFIPNYGVRLLRRTGTERLEDALESVARLDAEEPVEFASVAFRRTAGSTEVMFTTRRFVVQFRPEVSRDEIDALNADRGVRLVGPAAYMRNGFVLEAPSGDGPSGPVGLANAYVESGLALSATPDLVREVHLKQPVGTLTERRAAEKRNGRPRRDSRPERVRPREGEFFGEQWHLTTARVDAAWEVTTGDPAIVVAVLDDGVDVDHAEFAGKVVGQMDFAGQVSDARPKTPEDKHGTACAGVAVAQGVKAHGAAPGCSLLAVRTPEFLGVADEAEMFRWVADAGADVISCSWGPADGTGASDPLPDNVRAAIHYCVTDGRQGRGIPIVWAAGNGNESVSLDGYAANPDVMAIGASTSREQRAWYSDFGPEVWVCAPSSGSTASGERRIFTTDRSGAAGYNTGTAAAGDPAGDYTNDFGGTSSATPLVAGVVGLVLSVDPALSHGQVRDILRRSAERIGDPAEYDASGHSPHFGYGRVDARRAVDAAAAGPGETEAPAADRPWITAPASVGRADPPPTFTVGTGTNPLYAVEVATRWELFDGQHDDERSADTFYASWQSGPLLSVPTHRLPDDAWARLGVADRLYYRVHSARDAAWAGWQVSTPDEDAASAPSIEVTDAARDGGGAAPEADGPSISGPAVADRDGPAPTFTVDPAGKLYAVELATRWELFDGQHDDERTDDVFYGSWQDSSLLRAPDFQLPAGRWLRLRAADRLYYRLHTADDEQWTGWAVTTPDEDAASAPSIEVRGAAGDPGGGEGRTVVYPAATFPEALSPDDGIDYSDPVAGGTVPLIEVRDRSADRLSTNFAVHELAARRVDVRGELAAYARISPQLVEGLQAMREQVGAPISVNSCYRYAALNDAVDGAGQSQHMTGRAADIRASGVTPLDLARVALQVLGRDIGLGLGKGSLHVDLRGEPASWVYSGAALSEPDFDAWVRQTAGELGRSAMPRQEWAERTRPTIDGPLTLSPEAGPPAFAIRPGPYPRFGVELAEDWRSFAEPPRLMRGDPTGTWASWRETGLQSSGEGELATYQVPTDAWARFTARERCYYRLLCSWDDRVDDAVLSLPVERAEEAPSIRMDGGRSDRSEGSGEEAWDPAASRRRDERRWRDGAPAGQG